MTFSDAERQARHRSSPKEAAGTLKERVKVLEEQVAGMAENMQALARALLLTNASVAEFKEQNDRSSIIGVDGKGLRKN